MANSDKEKLPLDGSSNAAEVSQVEETRRKLMTKLVTGAFAVPTVLVTLNTNAAHASKIPIP